MLTDTSDKIIVIILRSYSEMRTKRVPPRIYRNLPTKLTLPATFET